MDRIITNKSKYILTLFIGIFIGFVIGNLITIKVYNNIYPSNQILETYTGNWIENDPEFIDYLNNNPIDDYYSSKLIQSSTSLDMTIVIEEWIATYDEEIESSLKSMFEIIDSNDVDSVNNASCSEEIVDSFDNYLKCYYEFVKYYKDCTVGYGTGVQPYISFFELKKKREMLFELAEMLYSWTGDFSLVNKTANGSPS